MGSVKKCFPTLTTNYGRHSGNGQKEDIPIKVRSGFTENTSKQGKSHWAKGSKYHRVAQNQDWQCPICKEHLFNGEQLHTHHIVRVADGGNDWEENLVHLHKVCHQHTHMGKTSVSQKA